MRAMDVILAFPQMMFVLLAMATVGPEGLAGRRRRRPDDDAARRARHPRRRLPVVERDFVAAAEALANRGAAHPAPRGAAEHAPAAARRDGLRLTYAIALIAALAFLGFTADPNGADWGLMINENRRAGRSRGASCCRPSRSGS